MFGSCTTLYKSLNTHLSLLYKAGRLNIFVHDYYIKVVKRAKNEKPCLHVWTRLYTYVKGCTRFNKLACLYMVVKYTDFHTLTICYKLV